MSLETSFSKDRRPVKRLSTSAVKPTFAGTPTSVIKSEVAALLSDAG
jgi:hypothetical protein